MDRLISTGWCGPLVERHGLPWVTEQIRAVLRDLRAGVLAIPDSDAGYARLVGDRLESARKPSLNRVINGTGVILHTNLGRAPLAQVARSAMADAAGYSNLEFDLGTGKRGSRYDHCVGLLCELTGAEDALVVNNCAAALALALAAHAGGKDVVVSHGELVEIGGGFRIPEVVEASGAQLLAVGTTNRTRVGDYAAALEEQAVGAILKVHRSNFEVTGFTEEAGLPELVPLGLAQGVPVIYDLGSGLLVDPSSLGLPSEPTPAESVAAGADLVTFSGDKLLGGPQAGILVGRSTAVSRARKHPLCRAVRTDKVTLAGLEATLDLYRSPDQAVDRIPTLRMLAASPESMWERGEALLPRLSGLKDVRLERDVSLVGGGTFPGVRLPTWVLRWSPAVAVDDDLAALRMGQPAVVARAHEGHLVLDLRTVLAEEEDDLVAALLRGAGSTGRRD